MVFPSELSYGPPLNDQGGGWYVICVIINNFNECLFLKLIFRFAVERTDSDIKIWFWPRCSLFVPYEVKEGLNTINPLTWVCGKFYISSLR